MMLRVVNVNNYWTLLGSYIIRPTSPFKDRVALSYCLGQQNGKICRMEIHFNPASSVSERFYLLK